MCYGFSTCNKMLPSEIRKLSYALLVKILEVKSSENYFRILRAFQMIINLLISLMTVSFTIVGLDLLIVSRTPSIKEFRSYILYKFLVISLSVRQKAR